MKVWVAALLVAGILAVLGGVALSVTSVAAGCGSAVRPVHKALDERSQDAFTRSYEAKTACDEAVTRRRATVAIFLSGGGIELLFARIGRRTSTVAPPPAPVSNPGAHFRARR